MEYIWERSFSIWLTCIERMNCYFTNLSILMYDSFIFMPHIPFTTSNFNLGNIFSCIFPVILYLKIKVWFIKTCTHIFTHSTILCQFFKNMYYFEEIRLVEHSKLLRQVKILQKMCPLHSHLKKKKFHTFRIFTWNVSDW